MQTIDVKPFVDSLDVSLPPVEEFWRLGDLTGLRHRTDGTFYRANYERGILLYALVAYLQPCTVLEFGTGRGYGCLCMAWAMEECGVPGHIYTIDMVAPQERFTWAIDWGDGRGPQIEKLSRQEVWSNAAPAEYLKRISELTGFSGDVMRQYNGPPIELAFIDGGHGYEAVRHDFYSVLQVAAERFGVLFDDYSPTPGFGIQKLLDEEVAPHFDATLIYTDRRWPGNEFADVAAPDYGMVWGHSDSLPTDVYPTSALATVLRDYRSREWLRRLQRTLSRTLRGLFQG